jgi:Predicted kinase
MISFLWISGTDNFASDAQNLRFVYEWRQEQERGLRATKGSGMTEEQVNHFVDGCRCPMSDSTTCSS